MSEPVVESRGAAVVVSPDLYTALTQLYADYAACLDDERYAAWPDFFTEQCRYRVVPRENHRAGLPLATMDLQSRGALLDRVYGIQSTIWHAPYYQRHIIGPVRITGVTGVTGVDGDVIHAEANYLVVRTRRDLPSDVYNAGRYIDRVVRTPGGLRFDQKICVFDSELILNSMIYPI